MFKMYIYLLKDDQNVDLSLKSNLIEISPLILQHCSQSDASIVQTGLEQVVAQYFPMSSGDLTTGSSKYAEYMDCLNRVCNYSYVI